MESLTENPSTPPPPPRTQTQAPTLSSTCLESARNSISDTKTFDLKNVKRKRRRPRLSSIDKNVDTTENRNLSSVEQATTTSGFDIAVSTEENTKRNTASPAVSSTSSSTSSSAPASKIRPITTTSYKNKEVSSQTKARNSRDEQAVEEKRFGTLPATLGSSKPTENLNSSPTVPKSSFRRTSSTRSALSLVFDISQNQTISRSTSASSSRCESRQGKYHTECQPVEDPNLKVENWSRIRSARSPRIRSLSSTRPGSEASLLGRRESVTNLVFEGQSNIDGDEGGLEKVYWKKLQLHNSTRSGLLFSKMATSSKEYDVTPGEFNVMVDEDYSVSRQSKATTPTSSGRSSSLQRSRTGFLYQVTDFDRMSKDVPAFVRNYAQKNGKMITESFILRLNYLRRRRQLGENSSTINIGHNSNSGHGHSHSTSNLNNVGKRSSPTAS